MASSWERRDEDKEARLYTALGATLNRLIDAEGASNAVIAQGCGEFYAHSIFKLFQVDITGRFRMTSHARYFKEGVGSSRPN